MGISEAKKKNVDKTNVIDKTVTEIEFEIDHKIYMLSVEDVLTILNHKAESEG